MSRRERKRSSRAENREMAHRETRRPENIERYFPAANTGLTQQQVQARICQGLSNGDQGVKTKSEKQIVKENVFTFFNILNLVLAVAVVSVGSYKNTLFMGLIFWNILIGCFQEIRSKRIIDKLSLISSPKATVIRNGQRVKVGIADLVLDDIMVLSAGQQICSDCIVVEGEADVNESLITGESDPISKQHGDEMLSGSFLVSGSCLVQVEHVGQDNYASQITESAKYVKKNSSEIMRSISGIIKVIGFGIIPIGILQFYKQYFVMDDTIPNTVVNTTAALLGMIPEGLVLLTSIVFAVSVVRLASRKTLVQDLYCVETLARVDTLCLDKTGTITEGTMQVDELVPFAGYTQESMRLPLTSLVYSLKDDNPTFMAVQEYLEAETAHWTASEIVPFSSARKWSGAYFGAEGVYVMGASEFILQDRFPEVQPLVEQYSARGQRVLLLAHTAQPFADKNLGGPPICIGLIVISDKIRREAPRTLRYFADQGVDLKVISGDNAITVANIAKKAGLVNADQYVDATTLQTDDDIAQAMRKYAVFGRVTPQQKLAFVKALKADGHTVAMTGDGVNDVLALKEADCSIAMASGSDAARTVSSLVLMDSNFASMPLILQEGRRSINNLQRSASLFLVKTIFSAIIAILFLFVNYNYPFVPIQNTLINALTIGVPSFILALEPNRERVKGKFLINVLKMSIPAGITMAANMVVLCIIGNVFGISNVDFSTLSVIVTAFTGFMMLFRVCTPFSGLRSALFGLMLAGFVVAVLFFGPFFYLTAVTLPMLLTLIFTTLFAIAMMIMLLHFVDNVLSRRQDKLARSLRKATGKGKKKKARRERKAAN